MAKLKPLDEWGVNNEVLSPSLVQRFLRVVQSLLSASMIRKAFNGHP
jgi:hypothetical protein